MKMLGNYHYVYFYRVIAGLLVSTALQAGVAEQTDRLNINAATLDAQGQALGVVSESDNMAELFKLQKQLVYKMLAQIGLTLDKLSPDVKTAIDTFQTTNMPAFEAFSNCLDWLDKGQFIKARKECERATQHDPHFLMALRLKEAIPDKAMGANEIAGNAITQALGTETVVANLETPRTGDEGSISGVSAHLPTIPATDVPDDKARIVSDQLPGIKQITVLPPGDKSSPLCGNSGQCGFYSTFLARRAADGETNAVETSKSPYLNRHAIAIDLQGNPTGTGRLGQQNGNGFVDIQFLAADRRPHLTGFKEGEFGQGNAQINVPLDRFVVNEYPSLVTGFYSDNLNFSGFFQNDKHTHNYDFFHGLAYFAEGDVTTAQQIAELSQNNQTFTYSGHSGADFSVGDKFVSCQSCGSFSAQLAYGEGKVKDFNLNIDTHTGAAASIQAKEIGFGNTGEFQFDQTQASFRAGTSQQTLNPADGIVAGRAFGPEAQSVGGVFAIQGNTPDGIPILGAGNFGGKH
jgi:hypothetical protein